MANVAEVAQLRTLLNGNPTELLVFVSSHGELHLKAHGPGAQDVQNINLSPQRTYDLLAMAPLSWWRIPRSTAVLVNAINNLWISLPDGPRPVGQPSPTPTTAVALHRIIDFLPTTAPSASRPGQARIYLDNSSNKVRISENTAPYIDLIGAGGDYFVVASITERNSLPATLVTQGTLSYVQSICAIFAYTVSGWRHHAQVIPQGPVVYVASQTGDDHNGEGSFSAPYETWQRAIKAVRGSVGIVVIEALDEGPFRPIGRIPSGTAGDGLLELWLMGSRQNPAATFGMAPTLTAVTDRAAQFTMTSLTPITEAVDRNSHWIEDDSPPLQPYPINPISRVGDVVRVVPMWGGAYGTCTMYPRTEVELGTTSGTDAEWFSPIVANDDKSTEVFLMGLRQEIVEPFFLTGRMDRVNLFGCAFVTPDFGSIQFNDCSYMDVVCNVVGVVAQSSTASLTGYHSYAQFSMSSGSQGYYGPAVLQGDWHNPGALGIAGGVVVVANADIERIAGGIAIQLYDGGVLYQSGDIQIRSPNTNTHTGVLSLDGDGGRIVYSSGKIRGSVTGTLYRLLGPQHAAGLSSATTAGTTVSFGAFVEVGGRGTFAVGTLPKTDLSGDTARGTVVRS